MPRYALALACLLLSTSALALPARAAQDAATAQQAVRLVAEGAALLRSDRIDEAEQRFAKAVTLVPSNAEAHYFLGFISERRKQQTTFRRRVLTPQQVERLAALITARPDATLTELRHALPTTAALSTLWRAVGRLGLTVKKNGTRRRTTPS